VFRTLFKTRCFDCHRNKEYTWVLLSLLEVHDLPPYSSALLSDIPSLTAERKYMMYFILIVVAILIKQCGMEPLS